MLISFETLLKYGIQVSGILHVGAHQCEERDGYFRYFKADDSKIVWIEAIPSLCENIKSRNPNIRIINATVSDVDGNPITFNISNNGQSSSMLELDKHKIHHPQVFYVATIECITKTIGTIYADEQLPDDFANFLNLDIQGAELLAIKGIPDRILKHIQYVYVEVNKASLYKGCALLDELTAYLCDKGFVMVELNMTPYEWGDAFFIRPNVSNVPALCFNNDNPMTNGEHYLFKTEILPKCKVVFDVGSRSDSLFVNTNDLEVHYFEPDKTSLKALMAVEHNQKSKFNPFGLSDKEETLIYYPSTQSFLNRKVSCPRVDLSNTVQLDVKRADHYIAIANINTIDFLKIDTEGYELFVIKGFGEFIKNVRIIQFEYGGTFLDNKQKLADVIEYLEQHGFANFSYLTRVGKVPIVDRTDHYQYCNIICYNTKL